MPISKGCITKQFTVWCGGCPQWQMHSSGTLAGFKSDIRAEGWRHYTTTGWRCPDCEKKEFEKTHMRTTNYPSS